MTVYFSEILPQLLKIQHFLRKHTPFSWMFLVQNQKCKWEECAGQKTRLSPEDECVISLQLFTIIVTFANRIILNNTNKQFSLMCDIYSIFPYLFTIIIILILDYFEFAHNKILQPQLTLWMSDYRDSPFDVDSFEQSHSSSYQSFSYEFSHVESSSMSERNA